MSASLKPPQDTGSLLLKYFKQIGNPDDLDRIWNWIWKFRTYVLGIMVETHAQKLYIILTSNCYLPNVDGYSRALLFIAFHHLPTQYRLRCSNQRQISYHTCLSVLSSHLHGHSTLCISDWYWISVSILAVQGIL